MTSQFPSTRAVMATPAILLFVATCLAQFISFIQGDNNVVNQNQNNNGLIRGATHKIVGDSSLAASDGDFDGAEVDRRRRSHHKKRSSPDGDKKKRKKSHHDDDHERSDDSFDFYVFSSEFSV